MIYKGYEIIGYHSIEVFNRLDSDGKLKMELNSYGFDDDNQDEYLFISKEQAIEEEENGLDFTQLSRYKSLDDVKQAIDEVTK